MQPEQKMTDDQGNQICLFPLTQLIVTQWNGPGAYSHCCGHMVDYGTHGVRTPVYAPCDMHLTYDPHSAGNTLFYCSDRQVLTPDGLHWVSIQLTHDNAPPYKQTVKQGELIYHSGNAGTAAVHLHLDQSFIKDARWINSGYRCQINLDCMYLNGTTDPNNVFFINDTAIIDDFGKDWQYFHGDTPVPPPVPPVPDPESGGQLKWWMFKRIIDLRRAEDEDT